jgi:hypothetical protein
MNRLVLAMSKKHTEINRGAHIVYNYLIIKYINKKTTGFEKSVPAGIYKNCQWPDKVCKATEVMLSGRGRRCLLKATSVFFNAQLFQTITKRAEADSEQFRGLLLDATGHFQCLEQIALFHLGQYGV